MLTNVFKNIIKYFIILILLASCNVRKKNEFVIDGSIDKLNNTFLYLKKYDGYGFEMIDSAYVNKGKFKFKGICYYPALYVIEYNRNKKSLPIFVENSYIKVLINDFSITKSQVLGSTSHNLFSFFYKALDSINNISLPLIGEYKDAIKKGDQIKASELKTTIDEISSRQVSFIKDLVEKNPKSTVSLYLMSKYLSNTIPLNEFSDLYNKIDTSIKKSSYAYVVEDQLYSMFHTQIGEKCVDICLPDTLGNSLRLSNIKSYYILLYFWASWDAASLKDVGQIISIKKKFGDHKIIIYSISLDVKRVNWCASIDKYKMNWINVSDLKGWKSYAAKLFNVKSLPYYVLIDKNGKIVDKNFNIDKLKLLINYNSNK